MKSCLKMLRQIPMVMIGAIDFSVCGVAWAVNKLAERGEKVFDCMMSHNKEHCCESSPSCCSCTLAEEE